MGRIGGRRRGGIVDAVTGTTYWDYVHEHVFGRCGMTGSAFYTRPQWLTDEHIAHSYMRQADGSRVDAVRNLDKGSSSPYIPGKNPGRNFIDPVGDGGFATAPDLVRFAHALRDGTVLDRPADRQRCWRVDLAYRRHIEIQKRADNTTLS